MRRRRRRRRKKKGLIDRLEANLAAALLTQAASAPATPELAASWRPLEASRVGAEYRGATTSDDEAEAEAVSARSVGDAHDPDGPRWPDESEEESMLAERAAAEPTTIREQIDHAEAARQAEEADALRDLPPLDDLIERIPVSVREGLEDLFRAKFTKVRRLPRRVFSRPPVDQE